MYLYNISVLVDEKENLPLEASLDAAVDACLAGKPAERVSAQSRVLDTQNIGRCSVCGTWASDRRLPDCVSELSNGAVVNGKWYCDICLPDGHANKF